MDSEMNGQVNGDGKMLDEPPSLPRLDQSPFDQIESSEDTIHDNGTAYFDFEQTITNTATDTPNTELTGVGNLFLKSPMATFTSEYHNQLYSKVLSTFTNGSGGDHRQPTQVNNCSTFTTDYQPTNGLDCEENRHCDTIKHRRTESVVKNPIAESIPADESEVPVIVLTSKDNSCTFIKRRILLNKPVKVGRAIGRTRQALDNAIFDCKVLSRNHALIWYQNAKFYLKDTGSSNGTFVNDIRLSSANEKSEPHELFSGDTVQFGVEVTEKKNVHSCVIASIGLYGPDGVEVVKGQQAIDGSGEESLNGNSSLLANVNISPSQLIELSFFIKDAMYKQSLLENQLESMQSVLNSAIESAKHSWNSLVEEDSLLSRIEMLQAKLEVLLLSNSKDASVKAVVETLREQVLVMISDNDNFERVSKCSLQKALEEKVAAYSALNAKEVKLKLKSEECEKLITMVKETVSEMVNLVEFCDKIKLEKEELATSLRVAEEEQKQTIARFEKEKSQLLASVGSLEKSEEEIRARYEELKSGTRSEDSKEICTQTFEEEDHCYRVAKELLQEKIALLELAENAEMNELSLMQNKQRLDFSYTGDLQTQLERMLTGVQVTNELIMKRMHLNDTLITNLVGKVCQLNHDLRSLRHSQDAKLASLIEQLQSQQEANHFLWENILVHQSTISKQNEVIGKFKCDIDSLNEQIHQTVNNAKQSTQVDSNCSPNGRLESIWKSLERFQGEGHELQQPDHLGQNITSKLEQILDQCEGKVKQNTKLRDELCTLKEKYRWLSYKNDLTFFLAIFPLLIIVLAIIIALYPYLSFLTATNTPHH